MFERVYPTTRSSRGRVPGNVVASLAVHLVVLGVAGMTVPVYVHEQMTEGIMYFAPIPVQQQTEPSVERITYVEVPGGGDGVASLGAGQSFTDGLQSREGQSGTDVDDGIGTAGVAALAEIPHVNIDSVYFPDEVDNPAAYDPRSAAPAYPDSLQGAGIEGSVTAQFIVDTTGRAADSSLVIIGATHPRFAQSVREALPRMLFRPAELSGVKIRQLVQQTFSFRLPALQHAMRDSVSARTPIAIPPLGDA